MDNKKLLIKKFFEEHSFIESSLNSFNKFIEVEMQKTISEIGDIIPTILPPDVQEFRIKLDKIWIEKPQITEADGSKRPVYPIEARLRKLTYSAPIFLEVSAYVDGVQRESFVAQIGKIPIMLKSKNCHLYKLTEDELIDRGEDPNNLGGYFIINGNERVIITVEDLLPNKIFFQRNKIGPSKFTARVFSQRGPYSIPHVIEQMKDGIFYISFTKFKRIPLFAVIKALGMTKDQEIMKEICDEKEYDDVYINLYNSIELQNIEDATEFIAKKVGLTQPREVRIEKTTEQIYHYLLPHIGITQKENVLKAHHLCKLVKRFLKVTKDAKTITDKDHYKNKKLKLSGELISDLFRVNMRVLVNDILYNFQRLVKRGKFQSVKIIIRDKLLTSRLNSAIATGQWVGGRKGISQNIAKVNYLDTLSHLSRVVSLLSNTQENFEAREIHSTHWGRLCPIETPEGTPIGLRKNLAMLAQVTQKSISEEKTKKNLENFGVKLVK
ncbi:DNA-directed RNA polymerase subunit B'' [archaeon]|jgi:DNA-directed RNA polymerase beta subunit|nr:DNA-directed RNA polymerase subunit B'' [archaeon]MBT3731123.1 DNA-directed RNA polymerase subunit B'' [archaeon]MBT5030475.1 DNA-directed RNA polymerase subunit B'' [archaeon]MBT5287828.1 DNA-directed RNA polymerase subunit B'' [archaeon]MBT7053010.1 DNA-directed RNA polymerase subunit B'' [archaeon]